MPSTGEKRAGCSFWGGSGPLNIPYYEKHVFSGLYIYPLVLPEPTNSQNEESKWVLHGLCSPPTGKTALLQAVQIQLFRYVSLYVCANHSTLDFFSNEGQNKAGFAS